MKKQLLVIYSKALGDTICATPTLRKLYNTYNQKISVVSYFPEVFKNNPCVEEIFHINEYPPEREYSEIHKTFLNLGHKNIKDVEKKHNVFDIRQFHATDLGFMLTPEEMTCEFYPDKNEEVIELPSEFSEGYIVLHVSNTWPSRTWSKENWIKLIELLEKNNINYVLVGKDDSESGFFNINKPTFKFNIKNGIDVTNKTSLSQTWNLINESKCVVTMDSGILHLAGTTDTHIIQLGSSINVKFRAPYRDGRQSYKYKYLSGECKLHCASDMKYGIKEWGSIQGVPPLINCLENKSTFECHPTPEQIMKCIEKHDSNEEMLKNSIVLDKDFEDVLNQTRKIIGKEKPTKFRLIKEDGRWVENKKKKLLYIAPHLSTGGMPKYLERCIELMQYEYDIYLIEYSFYSNQYTVQRNAILKMIDKEKFWSFEMDFGTFDRGIKSEVIDIIKKINPDIIHMQEIPEFFIQYQTADFIYSKNRTWKLIETTHTTTIDLNTKKYFPDKFAHVGNYIAIQYKNKFPNIPYSIVEYEPSKLNKNIYSLDLDTNYKHVLNIGIFTPNKRQDYVFKLAERLKEYKIKFHFIGNQANNFREYWEPLLNNKPVNCEIHGELNNVDDWYAECDLFIFPSKLENNPIVLKEAIGWNMPILYKNLDVYDNTSDIKKYDNAIELTEDIETDCKLILKILNIEKKMK